jgi:hypothetical protein
MADEKKHTTLTDLLGQKNRIEFEATSKGHDGFFPVAVQVSGPDGKVSTRGQTDPTLRKNKSERGRILVFEPTKEKVTILRPRVGQSYRGDWIHEVTTREGHKFLALQKQLEGFV